MHHLRSAVKAFLIPTIVILLLVSCGGGHSSSVGAITSISLTPMPTISLNFGDFIQMTATATDARGTTVLNKAITFNSNNNAIDIASNGLLCAGKWNSTSNPTVCMPAASATTANITASAQNVTSNTVVVSVHAKIASLQLSASPTGCVSQNIGVTYTVHAFDTNHMPIPDTDVGTLTWNIVDSTIGTLSTTSTGTSNTVTAALPGITTVTASVNATNPVTSNSVVFQECAVANLFISGANFNPNLAFSTSPAAVGDTATMSIGVTDTMGNQVFGVPISWNSSQPAVATINNSALATAVAAGTSSISATCSLNSGCNKNQGTLVTSNTVVANVGGTATAFVYAAGLADNSFVSIDPANGNALSPIDLGDTPNSLILDNAGNNAYLGTPSGLKVVSTSANPPSLTRTVSNAVGRVLTVSPNGTFVLMAGSSGNVLVYNTSTNTVSSFNIPAPTAPANIAAAYSPDSTEAVVVSDGGGAVKVYTIQGSVLRTLPFTLPTAATDVRFTMDGLLIYLANTTTPFMTACNNVLQAPSTSVPMTKLQPIPDPNNPGKTKMLGTSSPTITIVSPAVTGNANMCPPTISEPRVQRSFSGVAGFTANQIFATPDGKHAYITAGDAALAGKLLTYNAVTDTTAVIGLTGGTATTTTGGATADGAFVYVGASDSNVHVIDVNAGADTAQIAITDVSMNPFVPALVAVRPH